MLDELTRTHAEIMLRAVRDHLADSITTLPELLRLNNPASIHFYFGNMTAMRKHLAPELITAYQHWHETKERDQLERVINMSKQHWQVLAEKVKEKFNDNQAAAEIEALIQEHKLA
jgi:hypothetical protein